MPDIQENDEAGGMMLDEGFATGLMVIIAPEITILQGIPFGPGAADGSQFFPGSIVSRFVGWLNSLENPLDPGLVLAPPPILEYVRALLNSGIGIEEAKEKLIDLVEMMDALDENNENI